MAWPDSQAYYLPLIIQASKVPSTQSNFPVLIDRTNIHNDVVDPSGSNPAQTDGGDLVFATGTDGSGRLACEIVSFGHDTSTGAGDAVIQIYVIVPSVNGSSNTTIYMGYNTAGTSSQPATSAAYGRDAVWSSYRIVGHTETASSPVDSTGNGHTGSTSYTVTVTGQIETGLQPNNGGSGYISFASADQDSNHTVECWVKPANTTSDSLLTMANGVDSTTRDRSILIDSSGYFNYYVYSPTAGAGKTAVGATSATTNWTYLAGVEDGTNAIIYVNGSNDGSIACVDSYTSYSTPEWDMGAVASVHSTSYYDEFRVSNGARSADWLLTCYNNQFDPSTFIVEGTPTAVSGGTAIPIYMSEYLRMNQ